MPVLGIVASQISGHLFAPSGAYDSIATVNASGSSGTITFSSIPSTYTHLQIRAIARTGRGVVGDTLRMTFNGDSGSNYVYHALYGDGASPSAFSGTSLAYAPVMYAAGTSAAANIMGVGVIDILDYANTNKYKTSRSLHGEDFNGSGDIALFSGLWMSTTAINSITFSSVSTKLIGEIFTSSTST